MKSLVALLFLLVAPPSIACFVAPPESRATPDELIARSHRISLAAVVKAEVSSDQTVVYTFQTVRTLKGRPVKQFQINGEPMIYPSQTRNFSDHQDPEFWAKNGGRLLTQPDCKVHPAFAVGGTYLVFPDQPYHVKSFELIIRTSGDRAGRDKWLRYVEARTGP